PEKIIIPYYDNPSHATFNDGITAWPLGHSKRFGFVSRAATAPDGSAYSYAMPGIVGMSAGTNVVVTGAGYPQLGELHFFSSLPQAPFSAYPGRRVGRTLTNGWDLRGKLVQQRATGTLSANPYPLDFSLAQCLDLTLATNSVSFYVTSSTESASDYERRIFLIRSGPFP